MHASSNGAAAKATLEADHQSLKTEFNATFSSLPTTVFEEMSRLAAQHKSVNLGQGFPDTELEGPASMKGVVARSMAEKSNQYPPLMGLPELRQAVAAHNARHAGLPVDSATETLITLGATEALAAAFLGLLNAGDEVVVFEPLYDSYVPMIRRAGATPVIVRLNPPNWTFHAADLRSAFSARTKLVVVNTPHNPTGKVFTEEELALVARLCLEHGAYALLDEVYEHLVFPGAEHRTLCTLSGMAQRSLRIGSAGKTFSFTDFKVGWMTGPAVMVGAVAKVHQFLTFTINSALQRAVAHGLDHEQQFYAGLGPKLQAKRKVLAERLTAIGFQVLPADGTYFLVANFASLLPLLGPEVESEGDVAFCYRMTKEAGVTLIPVSAFYESHVGAPRTLVRFVFCKSDEKLQAACVALERYFHGKKWNASDR